MPEPPTNAPARWFLRALARDASAAVILEYALIAALIALAAIGAITLFATSATDVWTDVGREVNNALGGP
jgi:pilus assembly protein Flp/PilA